MGRNLKRVLLFALLFCPVPWLGAKSVPSKPVTIVNDYAATAHYIAPLLQDLRQQALERQQDLSQYEKLLLAEPQFMVQLLEHLEGQYGGVSRYLEEGGFGLTAQHQLISRLV